MTARPKYEKDNDTSASTSFQAAEQPDELHNLFEVPDNDSEDPLAHLRHDPNYAALIRDLEYIAQEARKIFEPASEEPSDAVWDNIKRELVNEEPSH